MAETQHPNGKYRRMGLMLEAITILTRSKKTPKLLSGFLMISLTLEFIFPCFPPGELCWLRTLIHLVKLESRFFFLTLLP